MSIQTFFHTTDIEKLRAATFLTPGEEILFAFTRRDGSEELVFTTESTLTVYKTRAERVRFSDIARLTFRDAPSTTLEAEEIRSVDQQQQKTFAFVDFVVGPLDDEEEYTIALETTAEDPGKKNETLAKAVFNGISILQRTVNLHDERIQSVEIVKNLLAEAQGVPEAKTASSWLW